MRKTLFALSLILALVGCTSHKTTVDSNGTTVTTSGTGNDQTVTVQGKEGTVVAGKGAVDSAKLGLPVYPGANPSENAGYSATTKEGSGAVAVLTTTDAFDKVYQWYKKQMPAGSEQMHMDSGNGSIAVFQIGKNTDKQQKVVTITSSKDNTSIMLTNGTKN